MKPGSKTVAVILLLVALVLVNYLASSLPVRFDATGDSLYSLSSGTKHILQNIEEPLTLDFYVSREAPGLEVRYKSYVSRVEEMLRQYARSSRGKLKLNIVTVRPDTPEEEHATAAGIQPQYAQVGTEGFYLGVVVTQADQQKSIPNLTPARESFLEYDLSKLIYSVQQFDKRKLGLITSLPLEGSSQQETQMMMMTGRAPRSSQLVLEEWRNSFNVITVEPGATQLPAGLDALAVIHPENISPKLQFAIDQFLLGGKPVFLAVDPSSQYFKQQGGQQPMMGGQIPNLSSNLPTLLNAYGIGFDPQKIVGDLDNQIPLRGPNNTVMRMPTWVALRKTNINAQSPLTAQLNSAWFIEPGNLTAKVPAGVTFTPLVETSDQTGEIPGALLQFTQSGEEIAKQVTPSGKKTLAALVTGKFKTAFPDGEPKEEKKPADPAKKDEPKKEEPAKTDAPTLKESKGTSTLFVVADTDWLLDEYSVQKINIFGQVALKPYNDNLSFAANTIEFLGGSQDLMSIRGKGNVQREFEVVRRMQVDAQKTYQKKLTDLEKDLQETEKELSELQGKRAEGNRLIATPEMMKKIEGAQKKQASLRADRREINRVLREDVDALEDRLLLVNLFAVPLMISIFGLWFYRHRFR